MKKECWRYSDDDERCLCWGWGWCLCSGFVCLPRAALKGKGKNKLPFGWRVGVLGGVVGVKWISLCEADRRQAASVLGH